MSTTKPRLVVIGNGMAGCRAVEEILALDPERYAITIIGAEPLVNYNRIMLSPLLAGDKTFDDIVINDRDWYEANGVELVAGVAATAIDREGKTVALADGRTVPYDTLVLATGSTPFMPPVPGADLPGVVTFRDVDDVNAMLAASEEGDTAVVVGGGLLGLEAAHGLAKRGMNVTVLHLMTVLMERQLDASASSLLMKELKQRGIGVMLEAKSVEFVGEERVQGVRLDDGGFAPADLVVVAAGIRPNTDLAAAAGLETGRGIVVDDSLTTSDPSICAVGECVEHNGACYGLVAPIWDQCRALASALAGDGALTFAGGETGTKLKVSGVEVYSAGLFAGHDRSEDIVYRDGARGIYKRLVLDGDRLVGAVLFGAADDGPWYLSLIKSGEPVVDIRETMVFGQAVTEALAGQDPKSAVAGWPDEAEVCGCNGVTKGSILKAIAEKELATIEGVRAATKASSSCGSCTLLVEQLLAITLGDDYEAPTGPKPVCACTDHGHQHVRERIAQGDLESIPDVMQALEWTTPDGCAACRPALNYYLLCASPETYVDDPRSRFVNERNHANIQKDGTYSVIPRMWGGQTSAKELRAIADAVEKFDIPTVKVTGGQRLDMLGVKKEDLPAVWADLNAAGLVSGHAYGKALRTVKTCVGSDWCRFGTQDSTGLGVKLERVTWGSWMPHKFKMAVSGCPRNCAEATIKDFGVVCVESGYELHVGGNGGAKVRATDLLCKVADEDEAIEHCLAFIQFYREDAWYLERTAPWLERVGLERIKARIVADAMGRKELAARFMASQRVLQKDPWAERAPGKEPARPFAPLARIGAEVAAGSAAE